MLKKITTDDGSETFHNSEYDDIYKTTSGAIEESIEKFARPADVEALALKGHVEILDIFFGLGYNSAAAIDLILAKNHDCEIKIVALENDPEIISKIAEVNPAFKSYDLIKKASESLHFKDSKIEIRIIMGDARETVKSLKKEFDVVFFDAFAPQKCPELWTTELFNDAFDVMKKGAILTTYTCAGFVRKNLAAAGFIAKDGPSISRRAPSTIAVKQ